MSVALTPELEEFVKDEVASGRFASETEVISEGLNALRAIRQKTQALHRDLEAGLAEIARGEGIKVRGEDELMEFFESVMRQGKEILKSEQGNESLRI